MNRHIARILLRILGLLAVILLALNLLTSRESFWAIWPIWVMSALAAALYLATRFREHPFLGAWVGGGAMLCVGLIGIDLANSGTPWWFWPVGVWLVVTALLVGLSVDLLALVPTQRPAEIDDDLPIDS